MVHYYKKEIPSAPLYLSNGKRMRFPAFNGTGLLATNDEFLIAELDKMAFARRGGVSQMSEQEYKSLRSETSPRPEPASALNQLIKLISKTTVATEPLPEKAIGSAFRTPGDLGDIVYGLPVLMAKGGGDLFLENSFIWGREPMTLPRIEFIRPLLQAQRYIRKVARWSGEQSVDMNQFRVIMQEEAYKGAFDLRKSLAARICEAHGVAVGVLETAWLDVTAPIRDAEVVIARSPRYHGRMPWKKIMALYGQKALFVGLPNEHKTFTAEFGKIPYRPVKDAMELARVIAGSRLFIGNQSLPFAIAEGLKHNSILEVWPAGPNCLFPRPNSIAVERPNIKLPPLEEWALPLPVVPSETAKHRDMVEQYCAGNGVDLGSGGDPVVPWAIQIELPPADYTFYNANRPNTPIQWKGTATELPFKDGALDFVHSSHLLEDFAVWEPLLDEWDRCIKPGGYMIIAIPDRGRFRAAVAGGQGDNMAHKHEGHVGELTEKLADRYTTIHDGFVNTDPREYSILYVGQKKDPKKKVR